MDLASNPEIRAALSGVATAKHSSKTSCGIQ